MKVSFIAKGKKVEFQNTGKRKAARQRKLSAYQKFVQKYLKSHLTKGSTRAQAKAAMRQAAKAWKQIY